jgi:hypothetical protein
LRFGDSGNTNVPSRTEAIDVDSVSKLNGAGEGSAPLLSRVNIRGSTLMIHRTLCVPSCPLWLKAVVVFRSPDHARPPDPNQYHQCNRWSGFDLQFRFCNFGDSGNTNVPSRTEAITVHPSLEALTAQVRDLLRCFHGST